MEPQVIPSSAFIKIGQKLITHPILREAVQQTLRHNESVIEPTPDLDSIYDIWKEWASLLVEYFGEYI